MASRFLYSERSGAKFAPQRDFLFPPYSVGKISPRIIRSPYKIQVNIQQRKRTFWAIKVQSLIKFIKLSIIYIIPSEIFCFLPIRSGKSHLAKNARLIKFRSIYNAFRKAQNGKKVQSLNKFIKLSIIYMLPSHFFWFLPIQSGKSVLAKTGSCPY